MPGMKEDIDNGLAHVLLLAAARQKALLRHYFDCAGKGQSNMNKADVKLKLIGGLLQSNEHGNFGSQWINTRAMDQHWSHRVLLLPCLLFRCAACWARPEGQVLADFCVTSAIQQPTDEPCKSSPCFSPL